MSCQDSASDQVTRWTKGLTEFSLLIKLSINSSPSSTRLQCIKMISYHFSIHSIFWKIRIQCFPTQDYLHILIYSMFKHRHQCPTHFSKLNSNATVSITNFLGSFHFKPPNTLYSPLIFSPILPYIIAICVLTSYSKV